MYIFIFFSPYSIKSIFDVSSLSSEYSLAYFISEDLQIFNGVYSEFKYELAVNLRLLLTLHVYNKCKKHRQCKMYLYNIYLAEIRLNKENVNRILQIHVLKS